MASSLYMKAVAVMAKYVEKVKVEEIMARKLAAAGVSPDAFGPDHMRKNLKNITGAVQLYIDDRQKAYKVADELAALV
jgi:hypothetical protein